jgi:hypothetical protein
MTQQHFIIWMLIRRLKNVTAYTFCWTIEMSKFT